MKTKIFLIPIFIITVILFTGCNVLRIDTRDLMHPPKATGNEAIIQDLISKSAGTDDYVLKYPNKGDNRSAIVMEDINNDGTDEAITFYSLNNNTNEIHLIVIGLINSQWSIIDDTEYIATSVDTVQFANLNEDNNKQIIVGWSIDNQSLHTCLVYSYYYENNDNIIRKHYHIPQNYEDFISYDFNNDGKDEILVASLTFFENPSVAYLYKYNSTKDDFENISEVNLNPASNKFINFKLGQLANNKYGVFIDDLRANNQVSTQVVYWDDNKLTLKNPLYDEYTVAVNPTLRGVNVVCEDIDDDNIVEIPKLINIIGQPAEHLINQYLPCYIIQWNNYNIYTDSLLYKMDMVINEADNYSFIIPQTWETHITANYNANEHSLLFKEISHSNNKITEGPEILELKIFDSDNFTNNNDYTEIFKTTNKVYVARLPNTGSIYSMTMDQVTQNLKLKLPTN